MSEQTTGIPGIRYISVEDTRTHTGKEPQYEEKQEVLPQTMLGHLK